MPITTPTPSVATAFTACTALLQRRGISAPTDEELATALGTAPAAQHPDRAALVPQSRQTDLKRQKQDHARLYAQFPSAAERLYALIK